MEIVTKSFQFSEEPTITICTPLTSGKGLDSVLSSLEIPPELCEVNRIPMGKIASCIRKDPKPRRLTGYPRQTARTSNSAAYFP